jgi:hypothetical protein
MINGPSLHLEMRDGDLTWISISDNLLAIRSGERFRANASQFRFGVPDAAVIEID